MFQKSSHATVSLRRGARSERPATRVPAAGQLALQAEEGLQLQLLQRERLHPGEALHPEGLGRGLRGLHAV